MAEIDRGMEIILPKIFKIKPIIMRAFQAAKTFEKAENKVDNDYITRGEFRILLKYIR